MQPVEKPFIVGKRYITMTIYDYDKDTWDCVVRAD